MSATLVQAPAIQRASVSTIVRAGALLALVDGLCAFGINALIFHQPSFARTFQGVASAILGKAAYTMGAASTLLGIAMHITVAFAWVTLYTLVYRNIPAISRIAKGRFGVATLGPLLGAVIWCTMNFVVFPMTRLHALPVDARPFEVNLVQHMLIVGPLVVAAVL